MLVGAEAGGHRHRDHEVFMGGVGMGTEWIQLGMENTVTGVSGCDLQTEELKSNRRSLQQ